VYYTSLDDLVVFDAGCFLGSLLGVSVAKTLLAKSWVENFILLLDLDAEVLGDRD